MFSESKLISEAKKFLKPRNLTNTVEAGGVACALMSVSGKLYYGVCIDASCSIGFCAEHSAIANMITHGENHILAIVAVDSNERVLPPCGRCREFIYQICPDNITTKVVISDSESSLLSDLLPFPWKKITLKP